LSDRKEKLADVAAGKSIGAFALTEPEAGSDVASMKTLARKDGAHWILDGEKVFISNAGIATHYIVFANADPSLGKKGISAFFVPHDSPGMTASPIPMSLDHPLGSVILKRGRVPGSALLADVG